MIANNSWMTGEIFWLIVYFDSSDSIFNLSSRSFSTCTTNTKLSVRSEKQLHIVR